MRKLIFTLLFLTVAFFRTSAQDRPTAEYILVLNSLNFQESQTEAVLKTIQTSFESEIQVLKEELQVPTMINVTDAEEKCVELLQKYPVPPKVVVYIGDPGWLVCRPLFDQEWKDVPTIICYSKPTMPARLEDLLARNIDDRQTMVPTSVMTDGYNVTTLEAPFYIEETVQLIRTLIPGLKKIAFISDHRYISVIARLELEKVIKKTSPDLQLDLLYAPHITTQNLLDTLNQYDKNTGIVYYTWFTPSGNLENSYTNDQIQKFIYGLTKAPVFTLTDFMSKTGEFAGGYFISQDVFGAKVVQTIREILAGKAASAIPFQIGGAPNTYLNYHHLEHHNVDPKRFPSEAVYYQAPPPFFERYKYSLIGGLLIVVLIVVLIAMRFRFFILKQKQKEKELKLSLNYQKLITNMPVMYVQMRQIFDKTGKAEDGVLLDMNPAFETNFGISKMEILDRTCSNILDSHPRLQVILGNPDKTSTSIQMPGPDGELRYYDRLIFNDTDKELIDIFYIDKTDSHKIWLNAEEYRRSLETILNNLPIATQVKNANNGSKYIFWNKKSEELFGIKACDTIGKNASALWNDEIIQSVIEDDKKLLKDKTQQVSIKKQTLLDGKEHYFLLTKNLINQGDGTHWILGSSIDITEMQESRQQLENLNKKNRLILKAAQMCAWTMDVKTGAVHCDLTHMGGNPEWMDPIFTCTKEQFFGHLYADETHKMKTAFDDLILGRTEILHEQFRVNTPDGVNWLESYAVADERDENRLAIALVGATMNINESKFLEQELLEAKERAENSDRLKSAFLANMSHEIRTPLNAIVGFSNILIQTEDPKEKEEFLTIIESNNQLLLQLINDILDLSKIEAGTLDFVFSDVDINGALVEVEQSSRLKLKTDDVSVTFAAQLPALQLYTDRHRFVQVVTNFVNNSIKFTRQGSITFGYRLQTDRVYFYVRDTGCGISEENLDEIFGRFVKLNSFVPGTGLGLSICKMIVDRLGGEIGVESKPGEGSCFWFTLPNQQQPDEPVETDNRPLPVEPERRQEADEPENPLILIAEDNPSNFKLFDSILGKEYRIVHAWNGQEAIELYLKHHPQLILMDIKMPVMDGYEAVDEIRKHTLQLPIVAVTAFAFAEDKERISRSGFTDYLSKPINAKLLREKIAALLGHRTSPV